MSHDTCYVSSVTCKVSGVTCQVSHITCNSQTIRARGLKSKRKFTSSHLSFVMCYLCHMSHVFMCSCGQNGEASLWRVCYQRGLWLICWLLFFCVHIVFKSMYMAQISEDGGDLESMSLFWKGELLISSVGTLTLIHGHWLCFSS